MNGIQASQVKCDFSGLSKGRLRAYNRAVQELERLQSQQEDLTAHELDDNMLDMLAAAGDPANMDKENWD